MLRKIDWFQFLEWMAYAAVEPFDESRADLRAASICSLLANINRDHKKKPKPFTIADFVLTFDEDERKIQPQRQTWQEQKMWAQMYAMAFNEPERQRRKRPVPVAVPLVEKKPRRRK